MSVYFYLKCEECKQCCAFASRSGGGRASPLCGDEWLREFGVGHIGHPLVVVSEFCEDIGDPIDNLCRGEQPSHEAVIAMIGGAAREGGDK